jgi:hypothetical protein
MKKAVTPPPLQPLPPGQPRRFLFLHRRRLLPSLFVSHTDTAVCKQNCFVVGFFTFYHSIKPIALILGSLSLEGSMKV